jgi:predicted transcriptional regulator
MRERPTTAPALNLSILSPFALDTSPSSSYACIMETVSITAERKAQLEEYAQRSGQDTATALDSALEEYLAWEHQDHQEAIEGIRRGYEDFKAGRVRPVEECFEELRVKYGLPR